MCFPKSAGGNPLTRTTSEDERKNAEIDKLIRKDKKAAAKQVKILLLGEHPQDRAPRPVLQLLTMTLAGAGESGKSTILKQMRIIYAEGFHLDERKEVRQVIFSNMIVAFKIIAEEMRELGVNYERPESEVRLLFTVGRPYTKWAPGTRECHSCGRGHRARRRLSPQLSSSHESALG